MGNHDSHHAQNGRPGISAHGKKAKSRPTGLTGALPPAQIEGYERETYRARDHFRFRYRGMECSGGQSGRLVLTDSGPAPRWDITVVIEGHVEVHSKVAPYRSWEWNLDEAIARTKEHVDAIFAVGWNAAHAKS